MHSFFLLFQSSSSERLLFKRSRDLHNYAEYLAMYKLLNLHLITKYNENNPCKIIIINNNKTKQPAITITKRVSLLVGFTIKSSCHSRSLLLSSLFSLMSNCELGIIGVNILNRMQDSVLTS